MPPKPTRIDDIIRRPSEADSITLARRRFSRKKLNILVLVLILLVIIVSGSIYGYRHYKNNQKALIPLSQVILHSVDFTIYYPDAKQLPKNYYLDYSSFSSNGEAVLFNVTGPNNQKLVFSIQKKPPSADIQTFVFHNIPLHNTVNTNIGQAAVGVLNKQTFVSLPTDGNSWIIMTAPLSISQNDIGQILKSLVAAK